MTALVLAVFSAAPAVYRLDAPDQTWALPKALDEISDLAPAADGQSVWAVDDEHGVLFRLSVRDGGVVQTVAFSADADFAAVAAAGARVFAGRSDGVLFEVDPATGAATAFEAGLPRDCDLEGLAHDAANERLLLACKTPQGTKAKRTATVWALGLKGRQVSSTAAFSLGRAALEAQGHGEKFGISAIALHPRTGHLYLLSAHGPTLAVLDASGAVLAVTALPKAVFPQPEGIAFLPDGTLVIATEARGQRARLLTFSPVAR